MNFIPTKFICLILFIFLLLFNVSCSKDSDLFKEAVAENIEKNIDGSGSSEGNDGLTLLTKTFVPVQDAYVQDGQGYDVDIIRIENGRRKSYLTFDLSEVNGPIEDAKLSLTVSQDAGHGTFEAHEGSDTDWTEDNLSSSNAPQETLLLGSVVVESGEGAFEIELNADDIVAERLNMVLVQRDGNDVAVASKENVPDVVPKLTLTYLGTPGNGDQNAEENTDNNNGGSDDSNNNDGGSGDDSNNNDGGSGGDSNTGGSPDRPGDNNYYVSVDGDNSNDGLSEANAFSSIQKAIDHAQSGDVVWVKAGNYGNVNLFTRRSGTASKPIKIIGYNNSPGDIVATNGSTYTYQDLMGNGGDLNGSTDMPLLINNTLDPDPSDRAFNFDHSYITVKNFKIQGYEYGGDVDVNVYGIKADNIFCNKMGNWNPSNPGWNKPFSNPEPAGNLNGNGFRFKDCYDCEISNSTIVNAGHVGIKLNRCDGGLYKNIAIYSTETGNATDYNFLIYASSNTTVSNLISYREDLDQNLMHQGRGYVLQCGSYGNVLDGAVITNTRIQVVQGPHNNVLKNVTIQGNGGTTDGAVMVGDAARDNIFYNFRIDNCNAIQFYGTKGVQCGYTGAESAGDNNFFVNFVVTRPPQNEGFITFDEYDDENSAAVGTAYVIGGTFHDATYAIQSRRRNTQLYIINTTFSNITAGFDFSPEGITTNKTFINCNFYDVNFTPPSGTNITTHDPQFTNATNGDFTLRSGSQLIGAGIDARSYLASAGIDFNNNPRPSSGSWSIGAYEQ